MAFDHSSADHDAAHPLPKFLLDLKAVFAPGDLTRALKEDLDTLAQLSDDELARKGLTRSRVERAVRRKHFQSLYG